MIDLEYIQPGRRTYWWRPNFQDDPGRTAEACAWAKANDLEPELIPDSEPIVIGRPDFPTLDEGPTVTVILSYFSDSPPPYEPQPGDELIHADPYGTRVPRTVPLKVAPPVGLLLDVAAEIQRAMAGDEAMREWVENCLRHSDSEPA